MRYRSLTGFILPTLLLSACLGANVAVAQQYPPPVPEAPAEAETCVAVEGEVGDEFVVGQAEYQGEVEVSGSQGAAGGQDTVSFYADPGNVLIGSVQALEDGSFSGILTLPAGLQPGTYQIASDVAGCTETTTLEVLSASGEGGDGTDVLGASATNPDDGTAVLGASGENTGNLPVTGSDILDLVLLALVLIGVGSVVRWWAVKRRRAGRVAAFGFLKSRPLALPAPSVPLMDTRGFKLSVADRAATKSATARKRTAASSTKSAKPAAAARKPKSKPKT